jgi:putative component of membrane protein insertase Oxa1/YidC/SpoIIIJ protein YidD
VHPASARIAILVAIAAIGATSASGCRPGPRVGAPCMTPRAFAPFDQGPSLHDVPRSSLSHSSSSSSVDRDAPGGLLDALVAWYQAHGRARNLPGIGCPFAPTCSVYARAALGRYGPLGVVLIVDRLLVREHPVASAYYPMTCVARTTRLVDDVP